MRRTCRYRTAAMLVMITLLAGGSNAAAQGDVHDFLSPGIKLGYAFGNGGGFIVGLELSFTQFHVNDGWMAGGVIDWDIVPASGRQKLHLGAEGGWAVFGVDMGPTLVIEPSGETTFGMTITPYAGILGYLYYSVTSIVDGENIYEVGLYGKLPVHVDSRSIDIF